MQRTEVTQRAVLAKWSCGNQSRNDVGSNRSWVGW